MAVPTVLGDLSITISSNSPAGGDAVGTTLDDYLRAHAGLIAQANANACQKASNLSDVTAATARTNLGLGTAATHATGDFLQVANNLSDLASVSTALTNLTLGVNIYTPTISNTVNIASSSVSTAFYARISGIVVVFITAVVAATAAGGTTSGFDVSLPVASTLSSAEHAIGVVAGLSNYGHVLANVATGKPVCVFAASTTSSQTINIVFSYRIL